MIPIGRRNVIKLPWSMIENCFQALNGFSGYDGDYFRKNYPEQAATHPCHVHVIGRIFVVSGLACLVGGKYILKK